MDVVSIEEEPVGLFFRDRAFDFETTRVMWYAPVDGADFGEVIAAVRQIRGGDPGSWHDGWSQVAGMLLSRAEQLGDRVSRGRALLRASNYLRTAEFFLAPGDPRRLRASQVGRDAFDEGLRLLEVDVTRSRIPFRGAEMETIFLRSAAAAGDDHVLVVHGGFDSIPEELYFTIGRGALERGLHVLIYEGPGQANLLRRHQMPFTHAWHEPAGAALDSLAAHCRPASVTGLGVSYGGHLLARAAARDHRYDGIVLFDYFPRMLEAFRTGMPRPLRGHFAGMPPWLARLIGLFARFDTQTRWAVQNGLWTFGAADLHQLAVRLGEDSDGDWEDGIVADVLILVGAEEHFFPKDLAYRFRERLVNARTTTLREFSAAEGGHLHCQNGAIHLAHEAIFDWIEATSIARCRPPQAHAPAEPPALRTAAAADDRP
jgi:hypothetical protein